MLENHAQLVINAIGTCYNVLQEQNHPDCEKLAELIRNWNIPQEPNEGSFDLRYRHFDGSKLQSKF